MKKNQQSINYASSNSKLSLVECRKTLNVNGLCYTDGEVILIRDWLYHMADIAIDVMNEKEAEKFKQN